MIFNYFLTYPHLASQSNKKSSEYKTEEYFNYNPLSYYDIDLAMLKYRQEQPKPGNKY